MFKMEAKSDTSCEILLYSLVYPGYTAMDIIDQLKQKKNLKTITLRINSDGGDVFEALTIYNYLKSLDAEVTVYIDGIAASAATVVACAGRVIMPASTMMMIHNPYGYVEGDSEDLRSVAEALGKIQESVIAVYTAKTGKSHDEIAELMRAETWFTAEEALAAGFCDEVIDADRKEPEQTPEANSTQVATMAVKAERERLQALDALMTPERKGIIMKAKYETFQTAQDIAMELLTMQARHEDNKELEGIQPSSPSDSEITTEFMAKMINSRRGY